MTEPLTQTEKESILTLCLMAAFADGGKSDVERAELKRIAENFPESDVNLAALYHRVLLRQVSAAQAAQALTTPETRQLAYEMAVCVCEADDVLNEPEKQFLAELRRELRLDTAETARIEQQADALAVEPLAEPASPRPRDRHRAGCCQPTVASPEVDKMILNYAILNGALELLPDSLATMAIIPLQMKMVYRIGKQHGYELDRGHIKELLGVAGVGLTSQVVEGYARKLLGGLLGKVGGGMAQVRRQTSRQFRDVLRHDLGAGPAGAAILRRRTQAFRHRTAPALRLAHGTGARPARQLRQRHPRQGRLAESEPTAALNSRTAVSGQAGCESSNAIETNMKYP